MHDKHKLGTANNKTFSSKNWQDLQRRSNHKSTANLKIGNTFWHMKTANLKSKYIRSPHSGCQVAVGPCIIPMGACNKKEALHFIDGSC
eukprot:1161499-Pelagomonas_calceolata.AAC.8